jgi:hypothetical protein
MARRQRVNLEALGVLVLDAVMREIVPAINQRIAQACAAQSVETIAPLAEQLATLAESVRSLQAGVERAPTLELLEQRVRATLDAAEGLCDRTLAQGLASVKPFEYLGVHDARGTYERNSTVTHRGSLWIARRDVPAGLVPGTDEAAEFWTLAVKCGRDARGT